VDKDDPGHLLPQEHWDKVVEQAEKIRKEKREAEQRETR